MFDKLKFFIRSNYLAIFRRDEEQTTNSFSLLYHLIDSEKKETSIFSDNIHFVSLQHLHEQLSSIKRSFTFISIEEHAEMAAKKKKCKGLVSVSIDDGYKASTQTGRDVFRALGIPVTYFVNTAIIEKGRFWRDKVRFIIDNKLEKEFLKHAIEKEDSFGRVRENNFYRDSKDPALISSSLVDQALDGFLKERGGLPFNDMYLSLQDLKQDSYFTWGNHTDNHYVMSSLSRDEQHKEMKYVEDLFSREGMKYSTVFSIPFGNNSSYNDDTLSLVADLGYKGVVLSSGNDVKGAGDFLPNLKKYNLGVLNRFMPANKPSIL